MDKKLSAFFERILDPDAQAWDRKDSASPDMAALAAKWADVQNRGSISATAEDPTGRLAAYLNDSLDIEDRESFEADITARPAEVQELMSARFYIDEVEGTLEKPPRQLLELALSGFQTAGGSGGGGLAALLVGLLAIPGSWRLAGGALTAAILAVVVVTGEIGDRATAPFSAVPAPQNDVASAAASQPGITPASASQTSAQQQLFEAEKAMQANEASKAASTTSAAKSPTSLASKDPCESGATSTADGVSQSANSEESERAADESRCNEQRLAGPVYGAKYGAGPAEADMPAAAPAESAPYSMDVPSAPAAMPPHE